MMCNGKILFSSLKGGVGKSSASAAVALALAADGYKTVIVDLDFRSRSLDLMLGAADRVIFNLGDYMRGHCSTSSLLVDIPTASARERARRGGGLRKKAERVGEGYLKLCPAPSETDFESGGTLYERIPEFLERIANETGADYMICDTGADSRIPAIIANGFATLGIVVSEQSRTALRAAEESAGRLLNSESIAEVRLLINNFDTEASRRASRAGILDMIDGCAVRCIGVIPSDSNLPAAQDAGESAGRHSPVTLAAANIARRIQGVQTPLFHGMKKERRRAIL